MRKNVTAKCDITKIGYHDEIKRNKMDYIFFFFATHTEKEKYIFLNFSYSPFASEPFNFQLYAFSRPPYV